MNDQEIFNKVARAIIAQGKPSVAFNELGLPKCLYRSPDGCKCAVGVLIPDDKYNPQWEDGTPVFEIATEIGFDSNQVPLLIDLQFAHDEASADPGLEFVGSYKENMFEVATNYGLTTEALEC